MSTDAPHLYLIAGHRNPTRALVECLDDTTSRARRFLHPLQQFDVNLIVLDTSPQFAPRVPKP